MLFRSGVPSILLPLTFYRFAVLGFGLLETSLDLAFSQRIGTGFRLQQTSRQRFSFCALHFIERVGNTWETGVSMLPTAAARHRKDGDARLDVSFPLEYPDLLSSLASYPLASPPELLPLSAQVRSAHRLPCLSGAIPRLFRELSFPSTLGKIGRASCRERV